MSEGSVDLDIDSRGVATVTFFHPAHNSLPGAILSKLAATIRNAGESSEVRVIILKSGGDRTFCAGASFDELVAITDEMQGKQFFSGFAHVINACRTSPKIILGRVQGKAIGGGVGVAAATDYCFATQYASVKLSELAIGIGPFVVGPVIARKIGQSAFAHLSLKAKAFESPTWAMEKGLYHQVFDDAAQMDVAVDAMASELCEYNPDALTELKRSLWRGTDDWDALLDERAAISGRLVLSEFTKDAIARFKSK